MTMKTCQVVHNILVNIEWNLQGIFYIVQLVCIQCYWKEVLVFLIWNQVDVQAVLLLLHGFNYAVWEIWNSKHFLSNLGLNWNWEGVPVNYLQGKVSYGVNIEPHWASIVSGVQTWQCINTFTHVVILSPVLSVGAIKQRK